MKLDPDRFHGSLLGLAIGDALGTTVEFSAPGSFKPLTDIVGGGPFHLKPGQWTDDTSMALCLADSLLESKGMNVADQAERYVAWWQTGYNSVTDHCFDIGHTVRSALSKFRSSHDPRSGATHERSAGNGSLMRLAPVPMFFAADPREAAAQAAESSVTTHGCKECLECCSFYAALIVGALQEKTKEELLSPDFAAMFAQVTIRSPKVRSIEQGRYQTTDPASITGSGYVVESMNAALWAFWNSDNFKDGALLAVNLGDDADTTGAIYGQLAGAYYGARGLPAHWLEVLAWRERITEIADELHQAANAKTRSE